MYSHTHKKLKPRRLRLQRTARLPRRSFTICLFLLACCVHSAAQIPLPDCKPPKPRGSGKPPTSRVTKDPCADYNANPNVDNFILCVQQCYDGLSWHGIRPAIGGVVPGSGFGGGISYNSGEKSTETEENGVSIAWRREFEAGAKVTYRKYWQANANLNLVRTKNELNSLSVTTMNFYGQVKEMPRLDFYGLGPESDRSGLVKFNYREAVIGADIKRPAAKWLDVGGAVEGIWPRLTTITDPGVRAIEQVYTEQTAPGLLADPTYLRFAVYVGLHSPGEPESRRLSYDFFYNIFYDWRERGYSFRRFDADIKNKFRLGTKSELRVRGRLSFSETREGQRIPFYLQETLGGSNIRGEDTLRGFGDYRFRDRNFALLQTDFIRELYGPVRLIVFYDIGKVAPSLNRFDEGRIRQTYGLGAVVQLRQLDSIMFRFYVALGSGEGSHTFFGPGDSLLGGTSKLIR